jgi:hypothetical protein
VRKLFVNFTNVKKNSVSLINYSILSPVLIIIVSSRSFFLSLSLSLIIFTKLRFYLYLFYSTYLFVCLALSSLPFSPHSLCQVQLIDLYISPNSSKKRCITDSMLFTHILTELLISTIDDDDKEIVS